MRVLITGTGFIGSYTAKELLDGGDEVIFYGYFDKLEAIKDVVDLSRVTQVKGDIFDQQALEITSRPWFIQRLFL